MDIDNLEEMLKLLIYTLYVEIYVIFFKCLPSDPWHLYVDYTNIRSMQGSWYVARKTNRLATAQLGRQNLWTKSKRTEFTETKTKCKNENNLLFK